MAAPWAVSRQSSPPAAFADLTVERGILRRKSPRKRISLVSSSAFPSDSCLPTRTLLKASLRSEEHTSELQSRGHLVCRLLLEKKNHFLHILGAATNLADGANRRCKSLAHAHPAADP